MRPLCIYFAVGVAVFVLLFCQLLLEICLNYVILDDSTHDHTSLSREVTLEGPHSSTPVVLWWAPIEGPSGSEPLRQCGTVSCYFTNNRQYLVYPQTKALMFYGSATDLLDLPLPRNGLTVLWALLHEESPRNNGPLSHPEVISLFNYTATFSRFSSYPITTQYLKDIESLTELKYFVPTEEKTLFQEVEKLAPVIYLQTDCSTPLNRDSYVVELSKYIQVDSYGGCLHNKDLPLHLQIPHHLETMMADDLLHLVAKYKFMLAIENGVCHDYITEKLWRPLITGTVPIYIGSPTITDWLPNNKSAILGLDYESPKNLAEHLHRLNTNTDEYNSYLSHKLKAEVTNDRLLKTVETREWAYESNGQRENYVRSFECFVCKKAHNKEVSVASTVHYSCPMPKSILSRAPNRSNFWLDSWFYSHCEAKMIRRFVDSGVKHFTKEEYLDGLGKLVLQRKCQYSTNNTYAIN